MKAIICVKIGENEPSTYAKFDKLYKHLDIVDVFPPKYDEKGNLRGMGVQGDKHFLGIVADFGDITNQEFELIRSYLRQMDVTEVKDGDGKVTSTAMNNRRFHKIDITDTFKTLTGFEKKSVDKINEMAEKRRNKQEVDMTSLNDYSKSVDFTEFAKTILHKSKMEYMYKNIGLNTKSLKTVLSTAISSKEPLDVNSNINNK